MRIQWFPGHMTKALRMMEENAKLVDAFGYVLDARAPKACFNPNFEKIIGSKPCVFILNKCDLADASKVDKWCDYFSQNGFNYVKVTATASKDAHKITAALWNATESLRVKFKQKGVFRPVRCLVLGVPNCGKSTIINCLSGRKTAITGDRPGVTKGKQWVRLQSGLELLDTPGTLWPKFEDEKVALHLFYVGSIKDDIVDTYEASCSLLAELKTLYPEMLSGRYGINVDDVNADGMFEAIASKRGYLIKGGETDRERCAKAILDDFRKGKIGKITLEVPEE